VSTNDFEISAGLRAKRLTRHLRAEAAIRGEAVTLARRGERSGLPTSVQPQEDYEDVVVETRVLGRLKSDR
jgi:hypothetical protein